MCDMSREIKFRVWDKMLKKFISPTTLFLGADGRISNLDGDYIIQQFVGKTDANEIEIFEGDIVNTFTKGIGERIFCVRFKNQSFVLASIPTELEVSELVIDMNSPDKLLIIGNVFNQNEQDTSHL